MKNIFKIWMAALLLVGAVGCEYDDAALWDKVNDLEEQVEQNKETIATLQALVEALNQGKVIMNVEQTEEGYKLVFSDGSAVEVKHGKDGANGEHGQEGDSFFKSVVITGDSVIITLADGRTIELPLLQRETAIYATGSDGTQGVYWRNGVATVLKSPISETPKWTRGKAITVVDGDVYVAGYETRTAILWINGEPTTLTDNTVDVSVHDMAIVGKDIYIVGAYNANPVYWLNGEMKTLGSTGEIRSVVVDGTDVYMSGSDNGMAAYWKNGERVALSTDPWTYADAYDICIADGNVYAAGYYDSEAATWLNGKMTQLTNDWNYAQCRSCTISGTDYYAAGNDGYNPVYWINGTMTTLETCNSFGTVTCIEKVGDKIYMSGISDKQAVVWVNGEKQVLAEANTGPSAYDLYVIEEIIK